MIVAPKLGQGMHEYWITKAQKMTIISLQALLADGKSARMSVVS
jgi:hypothetical protein